MTRYSYICLLLPLLLWGCSNVRVTEQKECEDPFIAQFKCDTELPCPDHSAPDTAPKVIMEWGQEFEF